jgi:hypothetical protein
MGELMGVDATVAVTPVEWASVGSVVDCAKRIAITGPSTVSWKDGLRRVMEHRHPGRIVGG